MAETCFVVMAIGDRAYNGIEITSASLKDTYANVIKEALLQARPGLEITRSDEVSIPGTITTDILTRLMHSTYVVVDVTYPNPNVFYELGIRHACKSGTLLIRDADATEKPPFDVSHLRYTEFQKTPAGIKELAKAFRDSFSWYDAHAGDPDNHLMTLAKLTHYNFPQYGKEVHEEAIDNFAELLSLTLSQPDLLSSSFDTTLTAEEKQQKAMEAMVSDPKKAKKMMKLLLGLGMGMGGLK